MIGDKEALEIMKKVDVNKDNRVSKEELMVVLRKSIGGTYW